jgi:hypothetical protein
MGDVLDPSSRWRGTAAMPPPRVEVENVLTCRDRLEIVRRQPRTLKELRGLLNPEQLEHFGAGNLETLQNPTANLLSSSAQQALEQSPLLEQRPTPERTQPVNLSGQPPFANAAELLELAAQGEYVDPASLDGGVNLVTPCNTRHTPRDHPRVQRSTRFKTRDHLTPCLKRLPPRFSRFSRRSPPLLEHIPSEIPAS